jgi:hypothetical protein
MKTASIPAATWKGWHIVLMHPVRSTVSTKGHHCRWREAQKTLPIPESLPVNLLLF